MKFARLSYYIISFLSQDPLIEGDAFIISSLATTYRMVFFFYNYSLSDIFVLKDLVVLAFSKCFVLSHSGASCLQFSIHLPEV